MWQNVSSVIICVYCNLLFLNPEIFQKKYMNFELSYTLKLIMNSDAVTVVSSPFTVTTSLMLWMMTFVILSSLSLVYFFYLQRRRTIKKKNYCKLKNKCIWMHEIYALKYGHPTKKAGYTEEHNCVYMCFLWDYYIQDNMDDLWYIDNTIDTFLVHDKREVILCNWCRLCECNSCHCSYSSNKQKIDKHWPYNVFMSFLIVQIWNNNHIKIF